jgi:hypothetical protein
MSWLQIRLFGHIPVPFCSMATAKNQEHALAYGLQGLGFCLADFAISWIYRTQSY